jgi:hypothetical protein
MHSENREYFATTRQIIAQAKASGVGNDALRDFVKSEMDLTRKERKNCKKVWEGARQGNPQLNEDVFKDRDHMYAERESGLHKFLDSLK